MGCDGVRERRRARPRTRPGTERTRRQWPVPGRGHDHAAAPPAHALPPGRDAAAGPAAVRLGQWRLQRQRALPRPLPARDRLARLLRDRAGRPAPGWCGGWRRTGTRSPRRTAPRTASAGARQRARSGQLARPDPARTDARGHRLGHARGSARGQSIPGPHRRHAHRRRRAQLRRPAGAGRLARPAHPHDIGAGQRHLHPSRRTQRRADRQVAARTAALAAPVPDRRPRRHRARQRHRRRAADQPPARVLRFPAGGARRHLLAAGRRRVGAREHALAGLAAQGRCRRELGFRRRSLPAVRRRTLDRGAQEPAAAAGPAARVAVRAGARRHAPGDARLPSGPRRRAAAGPTAHGVRVHALSRPLPRRRRPGA
jgi:hypothetical protein